MSLLDKLQKGSNLTNLNGATPNSQDLSNSKLITSISDLDLSGTPNKYSDNLPE
jgi:hypothetical protein